MIQQSAPIPRPFRRLAVIAVLASATIAAPALACQNPAFGQRAAGLAPEPASPTVPVSAVADASFNDALVQATGSSSSSIVGMWHTILRLGDANGPVFDEVLEQFHDDGTELLISNGLPPALGNVCIGIWKRVGARSYKLRHMTWNWSPPDGGFGVPGTFAGHFELEVEFDLDQHGRTFRGRWSAKNYDPSGEHLPDLDAEGVIRGVRLTVD
jgi:hypothetical protein